MRVPSSSRRERLSLLNICTRHECLPAKLEASSLDQLCLSPQCGFASNFMGNPVTVDDEKRKLSLVVEIAHDVWG